MSRHEAHAMETGRIENGSDTHLADVLNWISEMYCGLHGHDNLLQFESDRMFLKCASCGHESPGWEIAEPVAAERPANEGRSPVLVRSPLLSSRRVA